MWNVHFKDGCKDHVIPESHFEGSRAVVLGGGGQGVFQKAQRQVVLHHSVQHQANVVLWRSEGGGGGRAVSSGGWTAASALAEQSHLQGATLELVCWLVQTFWVICDWVSQQTLIWMKGIKPMICLKKMEATSSCSLQRRGLWVNISQELAKRKRLWSDAGRCMRTKKDLWWTCLTRIHHDCW